MKEDTEESWKAFENDTPAGRLLQKLYGKKSAPQINYPKIKIMKSNDPKMIRAPYCPGGGSVDNQHGTNTDVPVKNSHRQINVPKKKLQNVNYHAIDHSRIRRKRKDHMTKEINDTKEHYRTSSLMSVRGNQTSGEDAKVKLQQLHTFSRGTVLPKELLPDTSLLVHDLTIGQKKTGPTSQVQELDALFEAVTGEIQERRDYLAQMTKLGKNTQRLTIQIEAEIASRVEELHKMDTMIQQA